ncbi:MAG: MBL fold metallo-hydrolase [Gammaproteobacteria bacterium]|jgi:glyoxylase-like metal-dependent hydrolase (beta-lactamase superfamily II)|nr:MBL fold metallo-hydrolase [Gammaproteobacteria bacterium]MCH2577680.1 MBL fold metallo-hydrolase [Pseudomonadales bacterium]MEC7766339.1 MBL fold metallo-hydrolase [Pseudomonadota bacterium]MBI90877.1 MBL fold metallo-hydrolase [Gammaproteobacteria bacterium]MED5529564.1 MBL fold metallo-hydrolase [Pseudomonadota bacterium]|tara:strand:- start:848 stop:1714 length:867 start_codon:yes stop_codon:yes gene_type:complete
MKNLTIKSFFLGLSLSLLAFSSAAQNQFENVTIDTVSVAGNISMLIGQGGNIGVSAGSDGILIIDDQFAPLAGRIKTAIEALGSDVPKFLLNTHFHGDHTGGNIEFGAESVIVAHENVRMRMAAGDQPAVALPVVTFDDDVTIHFNGEDVTLIHMPNGHTDTDSVVMFSESNVIHMGDHFFNGGFPFVDLANGGTVQGYLSNLERALSWIGDDTAVIPGHGPLATKSDLLNFYNVVKDTSTAIRVMKSQRMNKEETVAEGLGDEYESWGQGFINEQRWIETVFDSYPR